MEDYIAQQEIIVPVVVGGILSVLLAVIFLAYVIAYAVRRRKEAKERQYEPLASANKLITLSLSVSVCVCVCVCVKCVVYVQ